jgi:hypothetical protein
MLMFRKFVGAVALSLATQAVQAVAFYPISSIQSSTAATDLWAVTNLIQGPGVGFDANNPNNKLLSGATGNWVTAAPGGFPADYIAVAGMPVLTIDLGADVLLSEISVWGYASSNANGVSEFSLRFATEAEGSGGFGTSIGFNPFYLPTNDDMVRQNFSFGQTLSARYVEFTARDNFFVAPGDGSGGETPGGDRVGLGEIAFAVSVPEPASLLLVGFGIAGMGYLRKRAKTP